MCERMEGGKGGAGMSIPQTTVAVLRKYGTDNRLAKQTALSEAVPSLWSVVRRTVALVAMLWLTQGGDRLRLSVTFLTSGYIEGDVGNTSVAYYKVESQ